MAKARRVAAQLGIPFYALDAQEVFHDTVVDYFIERYKSGVTPNPCLVCNRSIRWGFLLNHAKTLGAEYLATGHYVRIQRENGGALKLFRAADKSKDQSYVLSVLGQDQLRHALFPLGEYTKTEVRELARSLDLPVAESAESQDLCFLAGTNYTDFLRRNAPEVVNPGPILARSGVQLGEHDGLAFCTIGQRKGLGIAAPQPLYVLEKDVERNALVVGNREELGSDELIAEEVNWIVGEAPREPFRAEVKTRYTSKLYPGTVTPMGDCRAQVKCDEPLRDITPGQAAVFYVDEELLGGGIIARNEANTESEKTTENVQLAG
jgi:tRNA-specific 2-thiouridylase